MPSRRRCPRRRPNCTRCVRRWCRTRAGDFAQALMDLGAAICTPKRPACRNCPLDGGLPGAASAASRKICRSRRPRSARPLKRGAAFVARDKTGAVLLVKRPDKGLLASMLEPPLGPWSEKFPSPAKALIQAPFAAEWKKRPGIVRHGFTHFELEIEVYVADIVRKRPNIKGDWVRRRQAARRRLAHRDAQDRRARTGRWRPALRFRPARRASAGAARRSAPARRSVSNCQKVQPLQASSPCTCAPI